jgi:hypothetical protein
MCLDHHLEVVQRRAAGMDHRVAEGDEARSRHHLRKVNERARRRGDPQAAQVNDVARSEHPNMPLHSSPPNSRSIAHGDVDSADGVEQCDAQEFGRRVMAEGCVRA